MDRTIDLLLSGDERRVRQAARGALLKQHSRQRVRVEHRIQKLQQNQYTTN